MKRRTFFFEPLALRGGDGARREGGGEGGGDTRSSAPSVSAVGSLVSATLTEPVRRGARARRGLDPGGAIVSLTCKNTYGAFAC